MLPSTICDRVDPDAVFEPTHVADANSADSCNTHKEIKMKCKKIFRGSSFVSLAMQKY